MSKNVCSHCLQVIKDAHKENVTQLKARMLRSCADYVLDSGNNNFKKRQISEHGGTHTEPTQVEPDKILGVKVETDPRLKKDEYYFKPSELDTELEVDYEEVRDGKFQVYAVDKNGYYFTTTQEAEAAAEKIRNLLKGQS